MREHKQGKYKKKLFRKINFYKNKYIYKNPLKFDTSMGFLLVLPECHLSEYTYTPLSDIRVISHLFGQSVVYLSLNFARLCFAIYAAVCAGMRNLEHMLDFLLARGYASRIKAAVLALDKAFVIKCGVSVTSCLFKKL